MAVDLQDSVPTVEWLNRMFWIKFGSNIKTILEMLQMLFSGLFYYSVFDVGISQLSLFDNHRMAFFLSLKGTVLL